jgi:hypothetical protein
VVRTREAMRYVVRLVDDDYKGGMQAGRWAVVRTPADSAMCGVALERGQEYLLQARAAGRLFKLPILDIGLCDSHARWQDLTPEQQSFLDSRQLCDEDECVCADGSQPVNCFVDPCEVSSCDVEGATCTANYCGGCHAEWYDEDGARVCEQQPEGQVACTRDEPGRDYLLMDPATCATARFACADGLRPFFNECGCGCETACEPAGCSGQVCAPAGSEIVTTCEWRAEYACYRDAACEMQADGSCGWTDTSELAACLASPPALQSVSPARTRASELIRVR